MAKKSKGKGKGKKANKGLGATIKGTALGVVDEVEKAGGVVLDELKTTIDFITGKVTDTAKVAADTGVAVKDAVTSKQVTDQLHALVREVEEVGEGLAGVISSQFDSLRKTISKPAKKPKKKAAKKKAAKKKARKKSTARKKKATRKKAKKKATARKKTTRKKTTARKKASPRKKASVRKKTTRKKARARKRST
jgi:hypothetical protein